ncbi:MAG: hypothetical protein IKC26_02080 [Clostridia bacterium]|nr:hypothetical protein [Clostridia bacterium]
MKRDDIRNILNNADLDLEAKIDAVLNMRGSELGELENARSTIRELEAARSQIDALTKQNGELQGTVDSHKDYDDMKNELSILRTEKSDREMTDRFTAVVGTNKFKNTFTSDGVKKAFVDAVALEENQGKTDEEIYKAISEGKESEWYESPYRVSMTPSAGRVDVPTSEDAYFEEKYGKNPFFKKI